MAAKAKPSCPQEAASVEPERRRIVHMSNTRLLMKKEAASHIPEADLFIHTGNFTNTGTEEEFRAFDAFLKELAVRGKCKYRVVIFGPADLRRTTDGEILKSWLPHATHVLMHETQIIDGLRVYGTPWYPGHRWNYDLDPLQPDARHEDARFQDIPADLDILLTHGPAHGGEDASNLHDLDLINEHVDTHVGSKELARVLRARAPRCHLHGQSLNGFAVGAGGTRLTVCSYMKNKPGDKTSLSSGESLPRPYHVITAQRPSETTAWSFMEPEPLRLDPTDVERTELKWYMEPSPCMCGHCSAGPAKPPPALPPLPAKVCRVCGKVQHDHPLVGTTYMWCESEETPRCGMCNKSWFYHTSAVMGPDFKDGWCEGGNPKYSKMCSVCGKTWFFHTAAAREGPDDWCKQKAFKKGAQKK